MCVELVTASEMTPRKRPPTSSDDGHEQFR